MGGFLLLRVCAGLCDAMFMLEMITPYAQKYGRTIIWELEMYKASDITSIFDFSNYPVKVLIGKDAIKGIYYSGIEPSCYGIDINKPAQATGPGIYTIDGQPSKFDLEKEYPDSTLLIYHGGHGGWLTMKNFGFTRKFILEFRQRKAQLPESYSAIHLRATDHFDQKLEKNLSDIDEFVKDKSAVYLATDNMSLMESLSEKYPQIIKAFSYKKIGKTYHSLHSEFGRTDPDAVKNALLDIILCASSDHFLPSAGGFSRLINHLYKTKDLLHSLI